jgi:RHS repeat-associated protein
LIEATGREHIGQSAFQFQPPDGNYRDYPFVGASQKNNLQALRNYTEHYDYDPVGNFKTMVHAAGNGTGNWTRTYSYNESSLIEPIEKSNRLSQTALQTNGGSPAEPYKYDAHGNMVRMPHLPLMQWDFRDELGATSRQVVNVGAPETTYYVYDAAGQRARKITERQNGARKNERFYLGGFEVYREFDAGGTVALERETLHVMDDKQRIALIETRTIDNGAAVSSPTPAQRYQFGNHLGSASLELDEAGGLISYEEYSPYDTTTYQAGRTAAEVSLKRYRYTGKERDNETGLYYLGARYYIPWLGRWTTPEPDTLKDGTNSYQFVRNQPVNHKELDGFGWKDFAKGFARGLVVGVVVGLAVATLPISGTAALVVGGAGLVATGAAAVKTHLDYKSRKISAEQADEKYGELSGGVVGGAIGGAAGKGLKAAAEGVLDRLPSVVPQVAPELVPAGPGGGYAPPPPGR